jgi:hypothetical protein
MVPDVLLGSPPTAEKRVFQALSAANLGSSWQAFHSLNCSEHRYKRWSEIDFLIVGPAGLLVLEVKGGRVSVHGGIWTFTDRWGREHRRAEGPFRQAAQRRIQVTVTEEAPGRTRVEVLGTVLEEVETAAHRPSTTNTLAPARSSVVRR